MGILQRYVIGEVTRSFGLALLTMTAIFVLFMVAGQARDIGLSPSGINTAYNASGTLERTVSEIDRGVVDDIILVDDVSRDDTVEVAKRRIWPPSPRRCMGKKVQLKAAKDSAQCANPSLLFISRPVILGNQ